MLERRPTDPGPHQATWQIERAGQRWVIWFDGAIDARFDYGEILGEGLVGPGEVVLDLAKVTRIDCQGVSRLVRFISLLGERDLDVIYQRCSLPVVTQINQVPLLLRGASVASVYAPFVCRKTGEEALRLIDVGDVDRIDALPDFDSAGGRWYFDELPERFFAFLHRGRWLGTQPRRATAPGASPTARAAEGER